MPPEQLDNLVRTGKLKAEAPSQAELDGLIRSGSVRLKDAERSTLSLESRFDLAYNAAHALALAALRMRGYRSDAGAADGDRRNHQLGGGRRCGGRRIRSGGGSGKAVRRRSGGRDGGAGSGGVAGAHGG